MDKILSRGNLDRAYAQVVSNRGVAGVDGSKKSWKKLKEKIKTLTKKTSPIPFEERIQRLNWLMWGWVNYYKHGTGYEKFKYLGSWV